MEVAHHGPVRAVQRRVVGSGGGGGGDAPDARKERGAEVEGAVDIRGREGREVVSVVLERGVEEHLRLGPRREIQVGGGKVGGGGRRGHGGAGLARQRVRGEEEVRVGGGAVGEVGELCAAEHGETMWEVLLERGEERGRDGPLGVEHRGCHVLFEILCGVKNCVRIKLESWRDQVALL